jgi:hypothetical protein
VLRSLEKVWMDCPKGGGQGEEERGSLVAEKETAHILFFTIGDQLPVLKAPLPYRHHFTLRANWPNVRRRVLCFQVTALPGIARLCIIAFIDGKLWWW